MGKQFLAQGNYNKLSYDAYPCPDINDMIQKEIELFNQTISDEIKRIQEETGKKVTTIEVTKGRDAANECTKVNIKFIIDE